MRGVNTERPCLRACQHRARVSGRISSLTENRNFMPFVFQGRRTSVVQPDVHTRRFKSRPYLHDERASQYGALLRPAVIIHMFS